MRIYPVGRPVALPAWPQGCEPADALASWIDFGTSVLKHMGRSCSRRGWTRARGRKWQLCLANESMLCCELLDKCKKPITILKRLFAILKPVDAWACQQRVGKEAFGECETVLSNPHVFSCADGSAVCCTDLLKGGLIRE